MIPNDLFLWQIVIVVIIAIISLFVIGKIVGYALHSGWAKFDEVQKSKQERQQQWPPRDNVKPENDGRYLQNGD